MSQFPDLLQRVDSARAELDSLRPLDREREDRVMQKFRLWWTYHSNALEGNTLTQGETEMFLMEGLTAKNKPLKDHLDLRGHRDAIDYLLRFIHNKEVLTEAAIRKLQEILLVEPYQVEAITPEGLPTMKTVALGQYKTQSNHVLTRTGETHYYATPEETPAKMQDLMAWYRDESAKGTMHPVEIAARFHHRFTEIHPFDDGNGRMSRLLMNLMLMQAGYPPSVIRIGERDQYLAALRRADAGEYDDFLVFIAEHVVSSLELFVRAATGEEIHEPTDLEKEITLLKMELTQVEDRQPLTQEIQKRLFENSFDPLFAEIARLMRPLCELFGEHVMLWETKWGPSIGPLHSQATEGVDLLASSPTLRNASWWQNSNIISLVQITFSMKGFKKNLSEAFNLTAVLQISFTGLEYLVQIPTINPSVSIQHTYLERLSEFEITDVSEKLARWFFEAIKKRLHSHP